MMTAPETQDGHQEGLDNSPFSAALNIAFLAMVLVVVIILLNLTISVVNEVWGEITESLDLIITSNRANLIVEHMDYYDEPGLNRLQNETAFLHVLELVKTEQSSPEEARHKELSSGIKNMEEKQSHLLEKLGKNSQRRHSQSKGTKSIEAHREPENATRGASDRASELMQTMEKQMKEHAESTRRAQEETQAQLSKLMETLTSVQSEVGAQQNAQTNMKNQVEALHAEMRRLAIPAESRREPREDEHSGTLQNMEEKIELKLTQHFEKIEADHAERIAGMSGALTDYREVPRKIAEVLHKQREQVEKLDHSWTNVEGRLLSSAFQESRRLKPTDERVQASGTFSRAAETSVDDSTRHSAPSASMKDAAADAPRKAPAAAFTPEPSSRRRSMSTGNVLESRTPKSVHNPMARGGRAGRAAHSPSTPSTPLPTNWDAHRDSSGRECVQLRVYAR